MPVQDAKRDRIFAVGILTGGEHPAFFSIVRDADPHMVMARAEVQGGESFARAVTFDHLHSNQVLAEGLKNLGTDEVWDRVLELAGQVLEKPIL